MTDTTEPEPFYPYYVVRRSHELDQIAGAIAKAQGSAKHPVKNQENTHFKNSYADLSAVIDSGRVLNDNGVAIIPTTAHDEKALTHTLLLVHESGQWIESDLAIPLSKADAQGVGSALTYARRYHLSMMLNVASETDDDGNAAAAQSRRSSESVAPPAATVDEPVSAKYVSDVQEALAKRGGSLEDMATIVFKATAHRQEPKQPTGLIEELLQSETPNFRAAWEDWKAANPPATLSLEGAQ